MRGSNHVRLKLVWLALLTCYRFYELQEACGQRSSNSIEMVFVCPDRANEDREARIEAVTEPHLRVADDPNNKHHIRGAGVVTLSADPLIYNRVMCSE